MEKNMFLAIKAAVAGAGAAFTAAFGWFGWLIVAWAFCMAVDYITGSGAAMKQGNWSSARARDGLWHKAGMLFAVIAAGMLDLVIWLIVGNIPAITLPWEYTVLICPLVVCWYIVTELGSIVENAGAMGAPVPKFLRKAIAALAEQLDSKKETATDADQIAKQLHK
nr:MAG TPA: holin [Caudoviricetes sp.]